MWIEERKYAEIKKIIPVSCINLLVVYEKKILLMLRNNSPAKELWFSPGGRILKNESLLDAVERILHKETGLNITSVKQIATMAHFWNEIHTVTTYYLVEVDSDSVTLNYEHSSYKWIDHIEENLHPYLKKMIIDSKIFK